MSQPSNRADSNGNRPSAGPTPFSRQNSGAAARGRGGSGRGSAQQGRSDGTNNRNKGPRNQGPKHIVDPAENGLPPGLTFQGGPNLLSFGSFNSDASATESGPSRTGSLVNGPSSPPKHQQRQHQSQASSSGLPEKITFGNFQAGSPGGQGLHTSPPRHAMHTEMSGGMSPSQLQQQLAQRQHEGAAQPLHSHPQIMQRPQSHGLEGGHQQQQHPQGLPRHLQQQQPLQFGGHPHQGPPGHPQQSHSHFPPHLQQQSQQQHMQMGGHVHPGHQPPQATRAGSSSSSASGQSSRPGQGRGGRGQGPHATAPGQPGPKGMMTPSNPMGQHFPQMYGGQMMWGGYPQAAHPQHPHNMNDHQFAVYQHYLAQQQQHQQLGAHPSATPYPPGLGGQFPGPGSYSSQGSQQSGYGGSQGRGGQGRGAPGAQGAQAQPARVAQTAAPAAAAPAKPSRVLKITNPLDGAEVQVEAAKKPDKAPSAPSSRASSGTRVLDIVAPGDKPSPKKPSAAENSTASGKAASAPPATLPTPPAAPSSAASSPSLSVPAVDAPLGQPKGPDGAGKLTGDAPEIPRGPSKPTPVTPSPPAATSPTPAAPSPTPAAIPADEAIPEPTEKPLKEAAKQAADEAAPVSSADEEKPSSHKVEPSATEAEPSEKVEPVEGGSKRATAAAAADLATPEPAASPKQEAAGEAKQADAPSSQPAVPKDEDKPSAAPAAAALKEADKAAPAAAVAASETAPSPSESKSEAEAPATAASKASKAKPAPSAARSIPSAGKENERDNAAAPPAVAPMSPENGSVADKIARLHKQHQEAEAEAKKKSAAASPSPAPAATPEPAAAGEAAPADTPAAASNAASAAAAASTSKDDHPAKDASQAAAKAGLKDAVESLHAEPAQQPAKGTSATAGPAEQDSKADAQPAAPQESAKGDGPSNPPAPAAAAVDAKNASSSESPTPAPARAGNGPSADRKASGASEEAPAPAAAPALSKKGKKGQLGMKEAAGLRDPFSAPSPPVPAPAPTPAPAKAPEPEPAAAAPAEPKAEEAADDWEDATAAQLPASATRAASSADVSDGRKVYSRDFLRQFDGCTDIPEGLELQSPALRDVIVPELLAHAGPPGRGGPRGSAINGPPGVAAPADRWARPGPGAPGGFGGPGRGMGPGPPRPGMGAPPAPPRMADDSWGRAKPGPGGMGAPPPRVNRPTPTLHRTDNRYQIGKTQTDDPEEEKKQKEFKSLLNKITPDTFERILAKVKEVQISEHKTLEGLINQVFDKALIEPKFCELYADLCYQLNSVLPDFEDPEGRMDAKGNPARVNFRKMLINKCQAEFEKGSEAKAAVDKRDRAKEDAGKSPDDNSDDEADKEEGEVEGAGTEESKSKEERLEARREQRRQNEAQAIARLRLLGNMQFVGHLFKKKMLTEKIMHFCIQDLLTELDRPTREDVECLSKLLATIGQVLDSPRVDNTGRVDKTQTGNAKRTMDTYFQRIQTLSKNTRLESRLRFMLQDTIELRSKGWVQRRAADGPKKIEEVHQEAKRELMAQRAAQDAQSRGGGFSRGRQESFSRPMVPPPPMVRRQDSRPDAPFRTMQATGDTDSVGLRPGGLRLGPGGGPAGGRPATFGAPRAPAAESQRLPGPPPLPAGHAPAAPSAPAAALTRQPSATNPPAASARPEGEPSLSDKGKLRVGGMLEEYISLHKLEDAEQDFKDLQAAGEDPGLLLVAFFKKAASGRQRTEAASAIPELAKVLVEQWGAAQAHPRVHSALSEYMDELVDEVTDSPFLPAWLGQVLGRMVAEETIPFKPVAHSIHEAGTGPDAEESLVDNGAASTLLGSLLQQLAQSNADVQSIWASSGLQLPQFFMASTSDEKITQWKKKFDLDTALP